MRAVPPRSAAQNAHVHDGAAYCRTVTAPMDSSADTNAPVPWWRRACIYQVYPRSFADANGDGTGDIEGIRSRLPYLRDLGVDAIWISPWYPSPLKDGGYDVADYRDIHPMFGTLDDAERMIAEAHERGIRVIVDLVPNHTSSDHRWFRAALAAGPGSPERARYVFRPGSGPDGDRPPNNWRSVFGGSAWTRVGDGEWYLHLFDSSQPDLDWQNDEVRAEFDDILRFWIARGVDGFRVDVAHGMIKDPALPDLGDEQELLGTTFHVDHPHWDREGIHEINRRWRSVLDEAHRDVMMVAEAWVSPERMPMYLRPDEYHQSFNFDFLTAPWGLDHAKAAISRATTAAAAVGSTPTWTLSNHDVMRHASRYGLPADVNWRSWPLTGPAEALDPISGLRRARAATLLLMALPGSLYIYQGEELGLPEVWDLPPDVLDDPVWEDSGHTQKGRDGCRVPIPWTIDGSSFGFGSNGAWLPQPDTFRTFSVEAETDLDGSTLELYRAAIARRKEWFEADEELTWLDLGADVLAFRRGNGKICALNYGATPAPLTAGRIVMSSVAGEGDVIAPESCAWIEPDA
jgi:alpha-glucosidase